MSHSRIAELKIRAKILVKESLKGEKKLSLSDALDLIAAKAGFNNWRALVKSAESEVFCPPYASSRLNYWFRNYEEAKEFHSNHSDHYLVPYRHQFFVCTKDYLEGTLELDPNAPEVVRIGFDWAFPKDLEALEVLRKQLLHRQKLR